jgi:hypothetical protein
MAFLQLKKQYHSNKPIKIRLEQDPKNINGLAKSYNDKTWLEFRIQAVNIGDSYFAAPYGDKDPFEINTGQSFEFVMSEKLFNKINDYQIDESILIEMVNNGEKMFWKVEPTSADTKAVQNSSPVNNNRSLDIKWGMAFNNATRLVSNLNIELSKKVNKIASIMPEMFKIACLMETSLDETQKEEQKEQEKLDDLPF